MEAQIEREIDVKVIHSTLIDLHQRRIYPAEVTVSDGRIAAIRELEAVPPGSGYLMPGFVDAHVHVESSMLPPSEFARMAVVHGTVATVLRSARDCQRAGHSRGTVHARRCRPVSPEILLRSALLCTGYLV
jgi:adenine deaminase